MYAVDEYIRTAARLPAPPALVVKLINLANDPDAELDQIVELFQTNPALSARLLKLANSVFYGLRGEVTTVKRATVLLGLKTIRSLAVTVWTHSLSHEFQDKKMQHYLITLFVHSAACAVVGQEIAKKKDPNCQDDVFLACLLHDFGRLAMVCEDYGRYEQMLHGIEGIGRELILQAENQEFGFDHAQLGAKLALTWGFPEFLVNSALHHHEKDLVLNNHRISAMVGMADVIANALFDNIGSHIRTDPLNETHWQYIGLNDLKSFHAFVGHCEEQFKTLQTSMV